MTDLGFECIKNIEHFNITIHIIILSKMKKYTQKYIINISVSKI